jgi:hypothetical protein
MKKIYFIFLIVFGLFIFNITQAQAGTCYIQYSFDSNDTDFCYPASGSISTQQTSKTETAAEELDGEFWYPCIGAIPCQPSYHSWSNNCYFDSFGCGDYRLGGFVLDKKVCLDGTFIIKETTYGRSNDVTGYFYAYGHWDVVCDNTTTTLPTTTSSTTSSTPPTVVELSSFTATPRAGKVILQWSTESEIDNAGFNIYRATAENGEYVKINPFLIPAQGSSTQGASYEFIDTTVQNRKTYYYKLEDIDLNGTSTMHGPVNATPRLIYGMGNKKGGQI